MLGHCTCSAGGLCRNFGMRSANTLAVLANLIQSFSAILHMLQEPSFSLSAADLGNMIMQHCITETGCCCYSDPLKS